MKALAFAALCCCAFSARPAMAQVFRPLGPEGGDVLSFGADPANPRHVFLGTADGHIFASEDGGEHWELRGRAGTRLDSVVTAILVDSRGGGMIYAATWTRDAAAGGGVFRSGDGGRTWVSAGLAGKAVRALAFAPSAPGAPGAEQDATLVAGALDGVYRSRDAGKTWEQVSPVGDLELRNVDSVAVDSANADIIYAGTFHLPWKTTDGGLHWNSIHTGMIDDSDVMSLLADRAQAGRVYASACSGIYRSDNGGEIWQKVQGIPYTARRTVEILRDPARPEIVFAATTEGLWKTVDAGSTWDRITPADWSVTAMVVAAGAPNRVLIGVEQRGVMASDDGGVNFHDADDGFLHRQIFSAAADATGTGGILIALVNAPDFLVNSGDAGRTWQPLGQGPTQATLGRIYASPDGWLAALADGGMERYDAAKSAWVGIGRVSDLPLAKTAGRAAATVLRGASANFGAVVNDMAFARNKWYAATLDGLLVSADRGANWNPVRIGALGKLPVESVWASSDGGELWVASLISIAHSVDGGVSWEWIDVPAGLGVIERLEVTGGNSGGAGGSAAILLVQTYAGLFISRDAGKTWDKTGHGLPEAPIQDVAAAGPNFLAAMRFGGLYLSRDYGQSWRPVTGSMAEGFFSALLPAPNSTAMPDSPADGAPTIFYAASATEGLYAIEIAPEADLATEGDTRH